MAAGAVSAYKILLHLCGSMVGEQGELSSREVLGTPVTQQLCYCEMLLSRFVAPLDICRVFHSESKDNYQFDLSNQKYYMSNTTHCR